MSLEIQSSRLLLRPFSGGDADELHDLWTSPGVRKYLWDDLIIARQTVAEIIDLSIESFDTEGFGFWRMGFNYDPRIIGFCGLRRFDYPPSPKREVEILYGVADDHWGKGLATESAGAVLSFGFEQAGLDRIYAGADPPNAASFRVMQKLGMKFSSRTSVNGLEAIYYVIELGDASQIDRNVRSCREEDDISGDRKTN
jgi:RimJ/RimL family protein N-acetyltransferase